MEQGHAISESSSPLATKRALDEPTSQTTSAKRFKESSEPLTNEVASGDLHASASHNNDMSTSQDLGTHGANDTALEQATLPASASTSTITNPLASSIANHTFATSTTGDSVAPEISLASRNGKGKGKGKVNENLPDKRSRIRHQRERKGTRPEGEENIKTDDSKKPRLSKRKVALLIGFSGTGYNGMQIQSNNIDARTIEGTLFAAMVKAGAVSEDNSDNPTKVGLQRAARTDAGVHAAGNIISLKMITEIPGVNDVIEHVNLFLPPEIRIWGAVRTRNNFNARTSCDSRVYEYLFPSYMLIPSKPRAPSHSAPSTEPSESSQSNISSAHPFWHTHATSSTWEEDLVRKRLYRADKLELEKLKKYAEAFQGTHNFHNYTVGREFSDRSTTRFMKTIDVSEPQLVDGMEWISVRLHGQSFMLHQIRKMIALMVLACRTDTPVRLIPETFGPKKISIPKAPSLGLLLEQPQFNAYNTKITKDNEVLKSQAPPLEEMAEQWREPIDFEEHRQKIESFKNEFIYERMKAQEMKHGVFDTWTRTIDAYIGDDFTYLNPMGIIPPAAAMKKGDKRENAFKDDVLREVEGDGITLDDEVDENKLRSEDLEG